MVESVHGRRGYISATSVIFDDRVRMCLGPRAVSCECVRRETYLFSFPLKDFLMLYVPWSVCLRNVQCGFLPVGNCTLSKCTSGRPEHWTFSLAIWQYSLQTLLSIFPQSLHPSNAVWLLPHVHSLSPRIPFFNFFFSVIWTESPEPLKKSSYFMT